MSLKNQAFISPNKPVTGSDIVKWKPKIKRIVYLLVLLVISSCVNAQIADTGKKVRPVKSDTVNMLELSKKEKPRADSLNKKDEEGPEENTRFKPMPIPKNARLKRNDIKPGYLKKGIDTIKNKSQKNPPDTISSKPLIPGLNGSGYGYLRPPDMGGAVNSSFLVETLNTQIRCFDKIGTSLSTVDLKAFFSALLPTQINVSLTLCDPHVLYDAFAQRWVITALANANSASASVIIAVSNSDDPTSTWSGYSFDVDASDDSWLDFPEMGINKNWVVVSGNLYPISMGITAATNAANCQITTSTAHGFHTGDHIYISGVLGMTQLNGNTYTITVNGVNTFLLNANSTAFSTYTSSGTGQNVTNTNSVDVFVIDKASMYAGGTPATTLYHPGGFTVYPTYVCDNTTNNLMLVADWNGNSGGNGYLGTYTISGTPAAPVLSSVQLISVPNPWSDGEVDAPQKGSSVLIRNNDSRMEQVVLRNGSLWCAHTVFLPAAAPTHAAVQWWQIDPSTFTVQQFGRIEDASAATFYAFPSIDVNAYNDIVVGYSSFSATQFGSADYAYHLHTDATGTMNADVIYKAGLAKYDLGRWGDYSSTITDPDLSSFWTLQEYAETPSGGIDEWGTEWNQVIMPLPDLYSQDRSDDNGAEPNPSPLPMYQSEDIWLRQTQDASHAFAHMTQDAEYRTNPANPNYVYVEVRNRGGAASSGTEQLSLYWAKAGSALSWPSSWDGTSYFDAPTNSMLMGTKIGTVTIPSIPAGGNTILEFPWMPPSPDVYTLPWLVGDKNHFCLLARITTSTAAPYGMTSPETGDLYQNVQDNNNIVWKNIEVYDLTSGDAPLYAIVGNLSNARIKVKFKFEAIDANGIAGFLNKGKLRVEAEGKLKEILAQNRITGDGIKDIGNGVFEVEKDESILDNIYLDPKDMGSFKMTFTPNNPKETEKGFAINFTQIEDSNGVDKIMGGQTFVFGQVKGFGTSPGGNNSIFCNWPWWLWLLLIIIAILLLLAFLKKKKSIHTV
jgi:hypothetical protein